MERASSWCTVCQSVGGNHASLFPQPATCQDFTALHPLGGTYTNLRLSLALSNVLYKTKFSPYIMRRRGAIGAIRSFALPLSLSLSPRSEKLSLLHSLDNAGRPCRRSTFGRPQSAAPPLPQESLDHGQVLAGLLHRRSPSGRPYLPPHNCRNHSLPSQAPPSPTP